MIPTVLCSLGVVPDLRSQFIKTDQVRVARIPEAHKAQNKFTHPKHGFPVCFSDESGLGSHTNKMVQRVNKPWENLETQIFTPD
jgi:hypothetical protein